jgi:hypothetical protein
MKFVLVCVLFMMAAPQSIWPAEQESSCRPAIILGDGKSVTFAVPCVGRADMTKMVTDLMGNEQAARELPKALKNSGEITLLLTTGKLVKPQ